MARISETAFVNSPVCGAPEGKFVILSRSKSCHINRMKTCIEIKKNPRISRGENKFEKMLAREVIILKKKILKDRVWHARIQKIFPGGGGGVQIPRRGLTEYFNMAKTNNLAIPGGGGGADPLSPLWIHPCLDSKYYRNNLCKQVELMSELNCTK